MQHLNTLSLEAVLDEPVGFEFVLPFSVEAIDREPLVSLSPVRVAGEVMRIEKGYALEARLAYAGELECSRCLAAYPFAVDEAFAVVLCPRGPQGKDEIALEKDDLDVSFYDDPVVPLAPIVEERIQMLVPMKPLCR
ncbi:MAG: YceD family protein, partial [Thermoanaerobaculia bacterium]